MYTYYCCLEKEDLQNYEGDLKTICLGASTFSFWKESKKRKQYSFATISDEALDLLYISSFVYLADCMSSREQMIMNWERKIKLLIPVKNLIGFENIKEDLISALNFLSGDYWDIEFRSRNDSKEEEYQKKKRKGKRVSEKYEYVSMLSGGLDSCIGAIDLLEENKKVLFVGSHGRGANVKPYQDKVYKRLQEKYFIANSFKMFSLERTGDGQVGELTTRSRSFSFFAHGIAMADVYNVKKVIIPENGVISLNVPLTWSRCGSSSTRTTHPHYMFLLNKILSLLGLNIHLINPYQFCTKGEMMRDCKNYDFLKDIACITMSCSHPSDRYSGESCIKDSHCGYCVPCTIRRAAFLKADISDFSQYRPQDGETAKQNFRSFQIGILNKKNVGIFDILASGPIHDVENFDKYFNLYTRGIEEIKDYLKKDE